MEQLKVENFLVIIEADLEVKSMTFIIGEQASGKSLLAKLVYYFREFLGSTVTESIMSYDNKSQLTKKAVLNFEKYFLDTTWHNQPFKIFYKINDVSVSISNIIGKSKRRNIKFDYSKNLQSRYQQTKVRYQKAVTKLNEENPELEFDRYFEARSLIYESPLTPSLTSSLFIPASRSFFANMQKSIFSFLASNTEIDPFIKQFGRAYENSKRYWESTIIRKNTDVAFQKTLRESIEQILVGKYEYRDETDWIVANNRKTNLTFASSGQQESLPMFIVLFAYSRVYVTRKGHLVFIEEPEAHLFPKAQKKIIDILSLIQTKTGHNFFITTHSPYILASVNNLILARDMIESGKEIETHKFITEGTAIKFENVAAYTIEGGKLRSILDNNNRIIDANYLDNVSSDLNNTFDSLLQLSEGQ